MLLKTLVSKRYIIPTIIVLIGVAFLARLGIWQLDRLEWRRGVNADIIAKLAEPPISLNEAALAATWPLPEDRDEIRHIRGRASGHFDFDRQVLLLHQNLDVTPGAHLATPLVLDGAENKAVLVDRGWITAADGASGDWAQFNDDPGPVTITGFLFPSQILFGKAAETATAEAAAAAGRNDPVEVQTEWYRLDIEAIQRQIPYELLPVYLLQSPPPEGSVDFPIREDPQFDLSEGSHMSYALQWFTFAIILAVAYVGFVRSKEKKRAAED